MRPSLAIIGGMGSGKTTLLTELVSRGYTRMSWADPVKDLARLAYGHVEKDKTYKITLPSGLVTFRNGREILQRIGTDALRDQVDADFWIKAGLRRMDEFDESHRNITWVNDDSRFPNEITALKSRGFKVVRLWVPDTIRAERLGIPEDELTRLSEHPSEKLIASLDEDITVSSDAPVADMADYVLGAFAHRVSAA